MLFSYVDEVDVDTKNMITVPLKLWRLILFKWMGCMQAMEIGKTQGHERQNLICCDGAREDTATNLISPRNPHSLSGVWVRPSSSSYSVIDFAEYTRHTDFPAAFKTSPHNCFTKAESWSSDDKEGEAGYSQGNPSSFSSSVRSILGFLSPIEF